MSEQYEFSLLTKLEGQTRAIRSNPLRSLDEIASLQSGRAGFTARIEWERLEQRSVGPWKAIAVTSHPTTATEGNENG